MIHAKGLPLKVWAEAINWAVHVLNRTINARCQLKTPYERIFKRKPFVDHYKKIGSLGYIFIPDATRTKLEPKSRQVIFVGYSQTNRAYRVWDTVTNKVNESNDIKFDEDAGSHYTPSTDHDTNLD
jgi:hypothetical protein